MTYEEIYARLSESWQSEQEILSYAARKDAAYDILFCRESRINGVVGFIFYGNDEVLPKIKFFQILKAFQKGCLLKTVLSIQDLDALLFSVRRTVLFFCLFSGYLVQPKATSTESAPSRQIREREKRITTPTSQP